jgi:hypothetical protein
MIFVGNFDDFFVHFQLIFLSFFHISQRPNGATSPKGQLDQFLTNLFVLNDVVGQTDNSRAGVDIGVRGISHLYPISASSF